MAPDDGAEAKVVAAVALTATVLSPRVREVLRRGAVHGLAAVLTAGDTLWAFARGVNRGVRTATVADARVDPASNDVSSAGGPAGSAASAGPATSASEPRPPRPTRRRPPAGPKAERGPGTTPPASAKAAAKAARGKGTQ